MVSIEIVSLIFKCIGSSEKRSDKERVVRFGLMAPCMKDGGKIIKLTEKEDLFTLMEMCMMVPGLTIRLTVLECTVTLTEPNMKDIGKKINSMDKD